MAMKVSGMIGAIVMVVVGLLFFPIINDSITGLTVGANASLTGVGATLAQQIPLFYVLMLVFIAIAWALNGAKELGE